MSPRIGDPLPRKFILPVYFHAAAGFTVVSAFTAWRGIHDWYPPLVSAGIALALLALPNLGRREREIAQVDADGVAVKTKKGIERIDWSALTSVRILTTDEGPWMEDVYFLLEGQDGKGCAVPHGAAVRIRLLEELQSRLPGLQDDKVILAMGCTGNASFTIWEKQ